ncbi:MAG: hypothetical protein HF978_01600 [Desulfobacteraceae bacterium]|nr:hypothetical protein [Desulfobacteraceae bacterium]MBC2754219.1 hypothetical protein [Desulfobacteraceae bacterium]
MNDTISVYKDTYETVPVFLVKWQDALKDIISDKYKSVIETGRAIKIKNEDAYKGYKQNTLSGFTFAGEFSSRKNANIQTPTGFIIPDLDHLEDVEQVFNLLTQDENIWFAFRSPGGDGIKCGMRTKKIGNDDDHKELYFSVEHYFNEVYGLKIDPACKDISRLTYVSHDPDLWINPNPVYFNIEQWKPSPEQEPAQEYKPPVNRNNDWKEKYGRKVLETSCNKIRQSQPNFQHSTRLKQSRLIGGFITSGFIDESEALLALEQAVIDSGAKKINAAMKTVKDGIEYGKLSPLSVESNNNYENSHNKRNPSDTDSAKKQRVDKANIYTADRMLESYKGYIKNLDNNQFKTGIGPIDKKIRGVACGEVLTIIARAGAFKTAMLQNLLFNYTKRSEYAAVFFSIEMPVPSVAERYLQILGRETGQGIENIYRSNNPHHIKIMEDQFKEDMKRVFIVPTKISLSDIGGYVRLIESVYNEKVGVIGIDYMGLIDSPGQNEYEVISKVARGAKDTAKLLNLPVVILSQVSRKGGDGEVEVSMDMGRGSGAIEEGADFVLGLWQAQKDSTNYVPPPSEPIDEYDLICRILKNRKGPKGSRWKLELDPTCFRIGSDASAYESPKQSGRKGF